jgi:hypothetical protein
LRVTFDAGAPEVEVDVVDAALAGDARIASPIITGSLP